MLSQARRNNNLRLVNHSSKDLIRVDMSEVEISSEAATIEALCSSELGQRGVMKRQWKELTYPKHSFSDIQYSSSQLHSLSIINTSSDSHFRQHLPQSSLSNTGWTIDFSHLTPRYPAIKRIFIRRDMLTTLKRTVKEFNPSGNTSRWRRLQVFQRLSCRHWR